MNMEYATSIQNEKKPVSQSDDESECPSTNQPDTVSLSTDLAPYMDSSAETLASTNPSDCEDSTSSESRLGDITVVTISSDDDNNNEEDNQKIIECVLKDASNSLNSDDNIAKPTRKKSFTLECPSPSLVSALQENRIGLEPSPDQKKHTTTCPNLTTSTVSNTSIPKARVPVSRSLMLSLAEKKEFEGTVVNPDEANTDTDKNKETKCSNSRNATEIPIPVLDISRRCKMDSFFGQPSFFNSNSTYLTDRTKADSTKPTIGMEDDKCDSNSAADSTYILNKISTTCFKEIENLENLPSEEPPFNPESNRTINSLLQKQRNLRQFLDNFNQNEELSKATSAAQEVPVSTDDYNRQISILESHLSSQQEEIISLKSQLSHHSLILDEVRSLKQRVQDQENSITLLQGQLENYQQTQNEWMDYFFEVQSVELEKKMRNEMEKFTKMFFEEMGNSNMLNAQPNYILPLSTESSGSHGLLSSRQDDLSASDSSLSSVKTVVQVTNRPSWNSSNCQFTLSPKIVVTPDRAQEPDMKPKFDRISAIVKGFLTRRLMKTIKVQGIIKTIKDTTSTALQIHADLDEHPPKSEAALSQDVQFSKRLLNQLNSACHDFHDIFFSSTVKEQLALIAHSRELRKNPRPKPPMQKRIKRQSKARSLSVGANRNLARFQKRRATDATPNSIGGKPSLRRVLASASPKMMSRRICRSSTASDNAPKLRGAVFPTLSFSSPPKTDQFTSFDNRSPSFF